MARPRTFDQADTLEAIRSQFWETGYSGTSIDDLMACTGLGKGSLYGAFGSKHEMFVAALEDYVDESAENFRAALEGDEAGAAGRLKALLRAFAGACKSRRGCMAAKAIAELAGRDQEVDRLGARLLKSMEEAAVTCIRQGQRAGDVRRDIDPKQLALMVVALFRGMESLGKAGAHASSLHSIADAAAASLKPAGAKS
jgi:AcrR family transcriptional regulator